jgi:hypothetical protein
MADQRRYNDNDRRSYSDGYGRQSADGSQRTSRRASYDSVERYPSGRPKTQRQYPDGDASGYANGVSHGSAGYGESSVSYERNMAGYGQAGASYGRQGSSAGYSPDNSYGASTPSYRRGVSSSYGRGNYGQGDNGSPQGAAGYDQDSRAYAGSRGASRGGYDQQDYAGAHSSSQRGYGRDGGAFADDQASGRYARSGQQRANAQGAPKRGGHAAPQADGFGTRLADTARQNPAIVACIAVGLIVIVIALAIGISSCSSSGSQTYVQAVSSTSSDSTATPSATPSATPVDTASTSAADSTTTEAATTADTGSTQDSTVIQKLTPSWPDDVSTVTDIYTYATTSFDKDATYNNGGVEDPWSPTGYFTTGDAELDQMVKSYCDSNTQEGLDAGDNAYYTYLHISWIDYVEDDDNQRPWDLEGDWRVTYAKQCFSTMSANCHEFAAAVQYILRYFGYADACAETCLVLRQSGSYGDHSLVFVTSLDGRACLIDTSMSSKGWLLAADSMTYQLDSGYRANQDDSDSSESTQTTESTES